MICHTNYEFRKEKVVRREERRKDQFYTFNLNQFSAALRDLPEGYLGFITTYKISPLIRLNTTKCALNPN